MILGVYSIYIVRVYTWGLKDINRLLKGDWVFLLTEWMFIKHVVTYVIEIKKNTQDNCSFYITKNCISYEKS